LHGTDTLVHDAMYFESETAARIGWGHSSATEAVGLALEAGVRRLVLFHHDPNHDDAALDRLLVEANAARARLGGELEITVGTEGITFHC
jgi:ribonuclease BN (tRNA processing enzyme)